MVKTNGGSKPGGEAAGAARDFGAKPMGVPNPAAKPPAQLGILEKNHLINYFLFI